MNPAWTRIGTISDIPVRGARRIASAHGTVAVFRTSDDRIFAIEDRCPHRGGPLSQGIVHDTGVACPLHGWVIDLERAEARAPDQGCIRRFDVRVTDGVIEVDLRAACERAAE
ncbi:nitrite reductase small subunit NirD [Parvibaculum sp.]|uniref:nitrite reductase small subunit NirD n=1 Tax=Parvibaculum sp. TaxID=2024848 RepID=UPI0034A0A60F